MTTDLLRHQIVARDLAAPKRLYDEQHAHAISLWGRGLDTYAIAETLGVNEVSVANSVGAWHDEQWKAKGTAA